MRKWFHEWQKLNPILADGEVGEIIGMLITKTGDGKTPWRELSYTPVEVPSVDFVLSEDGTTFTWNGEPVELGSSVDTSLLQPSDSDLTAIAALTTTPYGLALLELADAAAGRAALELGTAATADIGDFDPAGTATSIAATLQPLDSDLTAIADLSTTAFGRAFLDRVDDAEGRTLLGLGTASTYDVGTNAGEIAVLGAGGTLPISKVASGTPSGKKFVRDDSTLVEVTGRLFPGEGAPPATSPQLRSVTNGANPFTVPAETQIGDLVIVVFGWPMWTGLTIPAGWTEVGGGNTSPPNYMTKVIARVATAGVPGTSYSFTENINYPEAVIVSVWSDWEGSLASLVTASTTGATSPSVQAPANARVVSTFGAFDSNPGPTFSWADVHLQRTSGSGSGVAIGSVTQASAGATATVTPSKSPNFNGNAETHSTTIAIPPNAASSDAADGDFYLDKTNRLLYGPLTAGAWGTPTPLDEVTQAELDALDTRVVTLESAPAAEVTQAELDAVEAKILGRLLSGEGVPAAGAPTLRAATQVAGDASPTELTVPATVEEGDLVLVLGSSASTAPAGFTQVHQHTSGQEDIRAWWRIAPSGFAGTVLSWNSPYMGAGFLAAFSAIDVNDPFDSASAVGDTAPSVVAEVATLLVEAWMGSHVGGGAVSVSDPSGTISAADGDRAAGTIATRSVSAGATVGRSATISGALLSASFAFALRPHPSAMGTDGDFYLDKTNRNLYGPLTAGAWGTALPIDEVTQAELDSLDTRVTTLEGAGGGAGAAKVTLAVDYSLPNGVDSLLTWAAEEFDTDAYHDTATNPERLTAPSAGTYLVGATVKMNGATQTARVQFTLRKNGLALPGGQTEISLEGTVSGEPGVTAQTIVQLAAGDYIDVTLFHNSGTARTATETSAFWITRLF